MHILKSIIRWLNTRNLNEKLFGVGYGYATPSKWLHENNDRLFIILKTRGAVSGFGLALVETGLIGSTLICIFFINLFISLHKKYKKLLSISARRWFRMLAILYIVFCFDFYFYSNVLFRTLPMPFILASSIASVTIVSKFDFKFLEFEIQQKSIYKG